MMVASPPTGAALAAAAQELTTALLVVTGVLAAIAGMSFAMLWAINLGTSTRRRLAARREARRAEAALKAEVARGMAALESYLHGRTASS